MLENLNTLDIFLIVASIVVALVGLYLILILMKVNRSMKTANMITNSVDHFKGFFDLAKTIPMEKVNSVVQRFIK